MMRRLAMLFGAVLLAEGMVKQARPKQYMSWLVEGPVAYLPEPVLKVSREYAGLSAWALRALGWVELLAGAAILGAIWAGKQSRDG